MIGHPKEVVTSEYVFCAPAFAEEAAWKALVKVVQNRERERARR